MREALLQLRDEGLIDVLPNRGVIIKPVTVRDAEDVYQMRTAIEGYCAAYLARHAHEESGIAALARIVRRPQQSGACVCWSGTLSPTWK